MKAIGSFVWEWTAVVLASIAKLASLWGMFLFFLAVSPVASAQSGNVYRLSGAQSVQSVTKGVVLGLREVKVQPRVQSAYAAATVGAALGGLIGVSLGKNSGTAARSVLGLLGAALGGVGGQAAGEHIGAETAIEVLVETQGPYNRTNVIAIVQPLPAPDIHVGQAVLILNEGGKNRVIPAAVAVAPVDPASTGSQQPLTDYQSHRPQRWEQPSSPRFANWQE